MNFENDVLYSIIEKIAVQNYPALPYHSEISCWIKISKELLLKENTFKFNFNWIRNILRFIFIFISNITTAEQLPR